MSKTVAQNEMWPRHRAVYLLKVLGESVRIMVIAVAKRRSPAFKKITSYFIVQLTKYEHYLELLDDIDDNYGNVRKIKIISKEEYDKYKYYQMPLQIVDAGARR